MIVAVRAAPGLGETVNGTLPEPVRAAVDIVTHGGRLDACQEQPEPVVTETEPLWPAATAVTEPGATV